MKVAWFTPFTTGSAIGRCSSLITRELSRLADVHIWHQETGSPIVTSVPTVSFSSAELIDYCQLRSYDLHIYNLGNFLPFHREIFLASRAVPGITVLHDFVMHHFFAARHLEDLRDPESYVNLMRRHYGEPGARAGCRAVQQGELLWETAEVVRFPLFEEALDRSLGVIVHSRFLEQKAVKAFAGPVARLSLPYDSISPSPAHSRAQLQVPENRLLAVTAGRAVPNKRIHSVLNVLARNRTLASRVFYAIVGGQVPGYGDQIAAMVKAQGLGSVVRIVDSPPDDLFHSYLAHADVFVNLRYPSTEGASASLIEEMLCGRPVVVSDTGFFSEIPDGCVFKIPPGCEEQELERTLLALANSAQLREETGARAKAYAESEFRADRYAAGVMRFAGEVLSSGPVLRLADLVADEMRTMGFTAESPFVELFAGRCHSLFGGGAPGGLK